MILYVVGVPLVLYGAAMMTKGWIYTFRPTGPVALKQQKKNLQRGFTTDMKIFGRKIRRLGLMILLVGGVCLGWQLSHRADDVPNTDHPPGTVG